MGTNYYVVSKDTNKVATKLYKTYKRLYDGDELETVVKLAVMRKFKKTMKFLSENGLESKIGIFEDRLDDAVQKFVCDIKYDVLDELNLEEKERVHIGKSSYGWLFGFQSQNTEICGIPLKWNNYEQVKSWLNEYVEKKKMFVIQDEYDKNISVKDFIKLVDDKQNDPFNLQNKENFSNSQNVNGYRFSSRDFS